MENDRHSDGNPTNGSQPGLFNQWVQSKRISIESPFRRTLDCSASKLRVESVQHSLRIALDDAQ
jgi:hypothetical protein